MKKKVVVAYMLAVSLHRQWSGAGDGRAEATAGVVVVDVIDINIAV